MGGSQKLVKMDGEINTLKAERNALRAELEKRNAEAYGMGLKVAIEKIKRQFPDLDVSKIDFDAK